MSIHFRKRTLVCGQPFAVGRRLLLFVLQLNVWTMVQASVFVQFRFDYVFCWFEFVDIVVVDDAVECGAGDVAFVDFVDFVSVGVAGVVVAVAVGGGGVAVVVAVVGGAEVAVAVYDTAESSHHVLTVVPCQWRGETGHFELLVFGT